MSETNFAVNRDPYTLGRALYLLRQRLQLRQSEIAERTGVPVALISSFETGRMQPNCGMLDRLLGALKADHATLEEATRSLQRLTPV
jgi:transcriptional regulator with XRE-family HTH domain